MTINNFDTPLAELWQQELYIPAKLKTLGIITINDVLVRPQSYYSQHLSGYSLDNLKTFLKSNGLYLGN